MTLCEIQDNRLVEAREGKYLEVLCVGIINNIWGKRERIKTYTNGVTSPLYEITSTHSSITTTPIDEPDDIFYLQRFKQWSEDCIPDQGEPYDHSKDEEIKTMSEQLKSTIDKDWNSSDLSERFRARVFFYSNFKYKNPLQFAKHSGIPYRVTREAHNAFKEKLKTLKLCPIS